MNILHYITGNQLKFDTAIQFFAKYDISITHTKLDTYEIQSAESLPVALSKAQQAWEILHESLFINDTCWIIPALNGFPGPYIKYINDWFSATDFIHLMSGKTDRTVILRDTIVYMDNNGPQVFTNDISGIILDTVYPGQCAHPSDAVISLTPDKKSLAELYANSERFLLNGEDIVWKNFADYLRTRQDTKKII